MMLIRACEEGNASVVAKLLRCPLTNVTHIARRDMYGNVTALRIAAECGHVDCVKLLLGR